MFTSKQESSESSLDNTELSTVWVFVLVEKFIFVASLESDVHVVCVCCLNFWQISVFSKSSLCRFDLCCVSRGGAQTPFKVEYLKVCALLSKDVFAVGTQQQSY